MTSPGALLYLCWEFLMRVFGLRPATSHLDTGLVMSCVPGRAVGCLAGEPYLHP